MGLPGLRLVFRRVDTDRDLGFIDLGVSYRRIQHMAGEDLVIELEESDHRKLARKLNKILEGQMNGREEMAGAEGLGTHAGKVVE